MRTVNFSFDSDAYDYYLKYISYDNVEKLQFELDKFDFQIDYTISIGDLIVLDDYIHNNNMYKDLEDQTKIFLDNQFSDMMFEVSNILHEYNYMTIFLKIA